jgi:hypothetical protein
MHLRSPIAEAAPPEAAEAAEPRERTSLLEELVEALAPAAAALALTC